MKPIKTISSLRPVFYLTLFMFLSLFTNAQMVTGVWHGKINGQKVEAKIIKNGDSITGTSYYYASAKSYRRYTIKGYVDETTNQVVWWDDQLVDEKSGLLGAPGEVPLASRADFNCPGGGVMKLDGATTEKNKEDGKGQVHLEKISSPTFTDEWDYVIDNYTTGTNDPYVIDSISRVPFASKEVVINFPGKAPKPTAVTVDFSNPEKNKVIKQAPQLPAVLPPQSIEQKFTGRSKKVFTTIPVEGDSITLSFYDNAIVDGDSISLFLDGRMLFTHLRLSEKPHTIKLAINTLNDASELTMVAENLGTIPPNTSYIIATMGDKRYTANLASTEESSAVIRLKKPVTKSP